MTRVVAEAPGRVKSLTWVEDDARANGLQYMIQSEHVRGEPRFYQPLVSGASVILGAPQWMRLDDSRVEIPLEEPDGYNGTKTSAKRYAALHARVVYLTEAREDEWKDMRAAHSGHYVCSWCGELKHSRGLTRSRMSCHDCYIKKGTPVLARKSETADA